MNQQLKNQGYLLVKHVLKPDIYNFLTHVLLRNQELKSGGDAQVADCLTTMFHDVMLDTVLEDVWPTLENIVDLDLLPTYAYARLYKNSNILAKHVDRPACEISLTIQLGRSHHYSWPIYMAGNRFDLAEGDGVIYLGSIVEHWREKCVGPEDYYSGQLFLHYVNANGLYHKEYADSTKRPNTGNLFVKHRNFLLTDK